MDRKAFFPAAFRALAGFLRSGRGRRAAALAAAGTALLVGVLLFAGRPKAVFLVDREFAGVFRSLVEARPGSPRWEIVEYDPAREEAPPGGLYGYRISADRGWGTPPVAEGGRAGLVPAAYRDLSRTLEADGALPLAVDPWMVFRRHAEPRLTRKRLEAGGPGVLLLPGGDPAAVWAWTAQDLQVKPGVFPQDPDLWRERFGRLPRDGRFQPGALTFTWEDVWPGLLGPEAAWVYAPLSRVQALPGSRTSLLGADPFPEREGWNEYGIQARVLWAVPFGKAAGGRSSEAAAGWLRKPETQAFLAAALLWAPAERSARPVNPLAASAQKAWIESSFVWEASVYDSDE